MLPEWPLWVAGGLFAVLIAGTFWLMFREGAPRARPWAYGEEDGEDDSRREKKDQGDEGGGGDGGGDD